MLKKRASLIWVFLLAVISISASIFIYKVEYPSRMLSQIITQRRLSSAEDNSLIAHFTYSNPKKAGLSDEMSMPIYHVEDLTKEIAKDQKDLEKLRSLDFSRNTHSLSKQTLCNALMFSLKHEIALSEYPYFNEPFAPYSGVQCELPVLLTEYSFRNKKDVENYLEILALIPDYLQGLCQYEKEKAANGLFMSDACADTVIRSLDDFCSLADNENPYLSTFKSRLKELYKNRKITKKEYAYFVNENERLVKTVLFPAYQKTGDSLTLLKSGDKSVPKGLCHYPGGKEYYEILVCSELGEDLPIYALKNAFCRQLQEDYTDFQALLSEHTDYFISIMGKEDEYDPLKQLSAEECMYILQKKCGQDFGEITPSAYPYTVKTVEDSMEDYTNPAYYFTPPVDDLNHNIIYINKAHTPKGLSLFTTLAHEGFPGHLYQSVTSNRSLTDRNLSPLSGITYYGGYIEGYATYVEFLSYDYAKQAAMELSLNNQSDYYYDFLMYQRRICLTLYSLFDIMIHYDGASASDIAPFLKRIGITNPADVTEIYNYIATEPGTYIKYYGGYLKILECKNLAKDVWGDRYNEQAFHELLMRLGPIDFLSLKNEIKALPAASRYF